MIIVGWSLANIMILCSIRIRLIIVLLASVQKFAQLHPADTTELVDKHSVSHTVF